MGVDESEIVADAIAELLRKNALRHDKGRFEVSAGGAGVLASMALRETIRLDERLHHDPHRDRIALVDEREHLSESERRAMGLQGLPIRRELTRSELQSRHLDVQLLLTERAKRLDTRPAPAVELLRVLPRGEPHFVWQEAELEVWHHPSDPGRWQWRILLDDIEDESVRERLRELEDDGAEVIPLDEASGEPDASELDDALSDLFDKAPPLAGGDRRETLISEARSIVFIGPSGARGRSDVHVLAAIADRLEGDVERVDVAVGPTAGRPPMGDPSRAVVERMRALANGRLTVEDVPQLGHGFLMLNGQRGFVTRFYWASYARRAGRGLWWSDARELPPDVLEQSKSRVLGLVDNAPRRHGRHSGR
jgi:hypothetical protein